MKYKRIAGRTPGYSNWRKMRERCLCPTSVGYKNYGGRGITICERWSNFDNFIEDMGLRPSPLHSIERIDNNGNYEPRNCRWATAEEQANNTRRNVIFDVQGTQQTMSQWVRRLGVSGAAVRMRRHRGLSAERALGIDRTHNNHHVHRQTKVEWLAAHRDMWIGWKQDGDARRTEIISAMREAGFYSPSTYSRDISLNNLIQDARRYLRHQQGQRS